MVVVTPDICSVAVYHALDLSEEGVCFTDEQPETACWIYPGVAGDFAELT